MDKGIPSPGTTLLYLGLEETRKNIEVNDIEDTLVLKYRSKYIYKKMCEQFSVMRKNLYA